MPVLWVRGGKRRNVSTPKEAMMAKILVAASAMLLVTSGIAYAEADTPGIDQRQANQERRIDQGISSGQLTERESARLDKQQNHIDTMENKAKADGVMTKKERARIQAAQDRASRNIARQKHDVQGKRHR
jgi:hypothetical protein